ncbi:hypothetical protein OG500_15765 [Kitasatospora sp. NBC_01250]|uniref:hypothetical protein n=1 Tax=unclassified Kitasatospora TaxID=2633591 RepID=UPI002E117F35|nr:MULTISPECIES: hypothetical protein [unclassified Kitasatospora]WSJ67629.1 hypothetical protein OG294_16770 [Kitasatospora sp. NBC_01302]
MSSGKNSDERNPFAPPPQDAPDQPWRPRLPQGRSGGTSEGAPEDGERPAAEGRPGRPPVPPPHPWSPNWQGGGGPGWPDRPQAPQQPRFDPNDPRHRRSRYALMSGMASLFCGLDSFMAFALLFGALALYWGISALRGGGQPSTPATGADRAPEPTAADPRTAPPLGWPYAQRSRPQVPAALGGLITGGVAVALVLGSFALQVVYRPYYTCLNDALTSVGTQSCSNLAPHWLVTMDDPQN